MISRLAALAAASFLFAGCSGSPTVSLSQLIPSARAAVDALAAPAARSILLPPPGTIYLGARVRPNTIYTQAGVSAFEQQIGRKLALDNHYHAWSTAWPGAEELDDRANGRIPVVAWNCGGSDYDIATAGTGGHNAAAINAQIDTTAAAVKGYGTPVMIRWFWEMNLNDASNGGRATCWDSVHDPSVGGSHYFSPKWFAAAFNYIVARFKSDGVTNVVWVWCPSAGGQPLAPYYPGDGTVDWLSFDNYAHAQGASLASTLNAMYSQLKTVNAAKPILVAESATIGSNQQQWLSGANLTLRDSFPNIKGFMYFDAAGLSGDWVLSAAGLAQFTSLGHSAYLSAK